MVGGHGPARLGDQDGVGLPVAVANFLGHIDQILGVLLQGVVGRGVEGGLGAVVVHRQPPTQVEVAHRGPQLAQLHVGLGNLTHGLLDAADIGHLAADVRVQHGDGAQHPGLGQHIHRFDDLGGGEAKLGRLAPRLLPGPRAFGFELVADANLRLHPDFFSDADHPPQLGELLQGDHHVPAQLFAHQGQPDKVVVLEAVAGDDGLGVQILGQDQGQLGFGAGLEAIGKRFSRPGYRLHHHAPLVDLDREQPLVAGVVVVFFDSPAEGLVERHHPRFQNLGEAQHHRQWAPLIAQVLHDLKERGAGALRPLGCDLELAILPYPKKPRRPVGDEVDFFGILGSETFELLQLESGSPHTGYGWNVRGHSPCAVQNRV